MQGPTDYGPALPILDDNLDCYYRHCTEILDKIRQDLKDAGVRDVDPRISAGMGAGEKDQAHTSNRRLRRSLYTGGGGNEGGF